MLQVTTYFRSVLPLQKILDNKSLRIVFPCEMHLMYIFSKDLIIKDHYCISYS